MKTTFQEVEEIVNGNDKKRFQMVEEVNADGNSIWLIRAVQGHSI